MASKTSRAAAAFLTLVGALASFAAQQSGAAKPLVRKDLLVLGKAEIAPPLRDIFRPRSSGAPSVAVRPAGPAPKPAAGTSGPEEPPSFNLSVSYVGSIKSAGRTIALVLRGGQTLSVSEGDEIVPGYRVVRVTDEAIVVQGPTGETRTFTKQGDRP